MHALAGFNFNWVSDTPENDELAKILLYYIITIVRSAGTKNKKKTIIQKPYGRVSCCMYI